MPLAAIMPGPGKPVEVREFSKPEVETGGVLLNTIYSEVCGTDVHLHNGRLSGVPYPIIPGHVSVGHVAEVGGKVNDVNGVPVVPGEIVTFLDVHQTCNNCWYCLVAKATTRCPQRKVYGITYSANDGLLGGWSEQIYLKPGVKIIHLPDNVPPQRLIAAGCALPTALHAIDRADIRLGDTVAVQGSGPVGLNAAILARLSGAGRVIVIDPYPHRLAVARRFACDDVVQLDLDHPEKSVLQVKDICEARGADITIEATGAPAAVKQGLQMTRDGGRYVIVGHYTDHGEVGINPHTEINRKHLEIRGCWGSDFSHFYRMVGILSRHADQLAESAGWETLVSKTFGLTEMNEALAAVAEGSLVKALVQPHRAQHRD
jgi:threonine dehydrogenase-like Zn-dependent dehydrogenase